MHINFGMAIILGSYIRLAKKWPFCFFNLTVELLVVELF